MLRVSPLRGWIFQFIALVLPLFAPSFGTAQYMYLDSNGDGLHSGSDRLSASGATTVDVWLKTNENRDGDLPPENAPSLR